MKKLVSLLLMAALALSLTACASGKDKVRVKCPGCGYEFEAPSQ